jgi:DNA polymerase-3 subunit delta
VPNFYIFHGDDAHSIEKTLASLVARQGDPAMLDLNTSRFDGRRVTLSELQHACDSVPFLARIRLVIVNDLFTAKVDFVDELLAYLPHLPKTTRLVFVESRILPTSHPAIKLASDHAEGYVKSFEKPQGGTLERWIRKRVKDGGGQIQPQAVHMLAINVGSELAILDNEIEKLVLYKGREPIGPEDVTLLCPYAAEASIWDMVDAIGSRHSRTAAQLLHKKLGEGADPFYLFAMIVRQFRLLIQVKELAEGGHSPAEAAKILKIHSFPAGKLHAQSKNYSMAQLERIYAHLLEMDVGVKTGQTDMVTAIELLVASVTT